ncbi:hypothetical protein JHD53_04975 [Peptacetobacter hiranonis]|uniref:hypothetical protein n=1 Tax=Peptacetobacter hiranonis TaxID=89152 RepID=UPI0019177582|nr:hypothetical protein [Peptacetobacter hiranonis]QQQ87434.1 hypothetical protein JHD53_04975 [Peptacetobacter hiranonis]
MNIAEALKIAKEQGKKVRPIGAKYQYVMYKNRKGFIKKDMATDKMICFYWKVAIEDAMSDWEVVPDKKSKQTQYKIDSMKFQIVRYCKNTECCNSECELYRKCIDKVQVDDGYSPKVNLLDDWRLKEIVEAYHILKETGEI